MTNIINAYSLESPLIERFILTKYNIYILVILLLIKSW